MSPLELECPATATTPSTGPRPSSGVVLRRSGEIAASLEAVVGAGRRLSVRERTAEQGSAQRERYYDLRDSGCSVGVVREVATPLRRSFVRRPWRAHGSLEAQLLDCRGTSVLLELERSSWMLRSFLEVRDPIRGERVGVVRRHFHPWRRHYTLEGRSGEVFATISSPLWRPWAFTVIGTDGKRSATIRKRWRGFSDDTARRGASADIDYGEHPWTLEQRCVLLAIAIAIDLDSVESDAG